MTERDQFELDRLGERLAQTLPQPEVSSVERSRARLLDWYRQTADTIGWTRLQTQLGPLFVAATSKGLCRISFATDEGAVLGEFDPRQRLLRDPDWLAPYSQKLNEYFAGKSMRLDLEVDISALTEFQRRVLQTIRAIPAGEVWTYGQVAAAINKPAAARAVGQALANNPIPIVLPCHRVIASDGSLGGYAGGLQRKASLLALEGARLL